MALCAPMQNRQGSLDDQVRPSTLLTGSRSIGLENMGQRDLQGGWTRSHEGGKLLKGLCLLKSDISERS